MNKYLVVNNFERFQHYKDRNPPWIKFYVSVLDNYEYGCLQDASKSHLMGIWLLASKMGNRIPADPDWIAKRIQATDTVDLQALVDQGFIMLDSNTLASGKQCDIPETETETETETNICGDDILPVHSSSKQQSQKSKHENEFTDWWDIYPRRAGSNPRARASTMYCARRKEGVTDTDLFDGVKRYRRYCEATDRVGTEYVMQACRWLGPNEEGWTQDWTAPKRKLTKDEEEEICLRAAEA